MFQLLFVRNLADFQHAILGYAQTIALAMAITAFCWISYGDYRPTFLVDCNPDMAIVNQQRHVGNPLILYRLFNQVCKTVAFPSGLVSATVFVWLFTQ